MAAVPPMVGAISFDHRLALAGLVVDPAGRMVRLTGPTKRQGQKECSYDEDEATRGNEREPAVSQRPEAHNGEGAQGADGLQAQGRRRDDHPWWPAEEGDP